MEDKNEIIKDLRGSHLKTLITHQEEFSTIVRELESLRQKVAQAIDETADPNEKWIN